VQGRQIGCSHAVIRSNAEQVVLFFFWFPLKEELNQTFACDVTSLARSGQLAGSYN
jgi:hypothetical protein